MLKLKSLTIFLAFYIISSEGYSYEKPARTLDVPSGHNFAPLSTVSPLPPVPALPPLPTARPKAQFMQTQTLYQTHPTVRPVHGTYLPPTAPTVGKIAKQYQAPEKQSSSFNVPTGAAAPRQPLRTPYGKQAVISFPDTTAEEDTYQANGRQLKQYAVIEIIDNDIEQNTQPFFSTPFFDNYRAHVGASGTGALPEAVQLGSKASLSVAEQQQRAVTQRPSSDAIALGSGGLGFIRLANGNVYLGSGSLAYISSQQHTQSVNEARTRTGAPKPDALHFGHGPLGGFNRFLFKFK